MHHAVPSHAHGDSVSQLAAQLWLTEGRTGHELEDVSFGAFGGKFVIRPPLHPPCGPEPKKAID